MTHVGIIGGAGYTAGELIRILIHHPEVEITFVHSSSNAGSPISSIHSDLFGETDMVFSERYNLEIIDILFLCQGHGNAKLFWEENEIPTNLIIIDLSRDFRLKETNNLFIYGLPELNRDVIRESDKIANPGCFATCIQLGLLPFAKAGILPPEVHIHATTGSTGAGQQPSPTTHFSWRNNNLSIYKPFTHQHLSEIHQSVHQLQPTYSGNLNFLPFRGDFSRGIYASIYFDTELTEHAARELMRNYYESHPFVHLTYEMPHLKQVVQTNKCVLYAEKFEHKLLIVSAIDNLLKGASGQAVQNMNLVMGWEEEAGLKLKAGAF